MAASIRVKVRLSGGLAATTGRSEDEMAFADAVDLRHVAESMGVSPSVVMLYSVNGTVQAPDYRVADGDEIVLIPAVSGGGFSAKGPVA